MTLPMLMKKPNIEPDASMYWPRVRMTPLAPAPKRATEMTPIEKEEKTCQFGKQIGGSGGRRMEQRPTIG
jgi:hypothetical protein